MKWLVLTLPKTVADRLTIPVFKDEDGDWVADEYERVIKKRTPYRGDILIVAKGMAVGMLELWDIEKDEGGWRWKFRNPRRCVPFPVKCSNGWFSSEQDVTIYPRYLKIGSKGWEIIRRQIGL